MLDLAYKRTHLAQAYCDSLSGKGIANAISGLFLAGPRRVGKSTFLIEDLIPEANKRRWVTVYVDLWSNKSIDPMQIIVEAIKKSIAMHGGKISKLTKHVELRKVKILKSIELDFSKPGVPDHITLTDLLNELIRLTRKPVLLLVDEAQHALATPNGLVSMFSIKSARDQINLSQRVLPLMLVLTGSNRDKLAQLVIKKDQPFFGSDITSFPLLGKDFTDFFTDKVNKTLARNNQFLKESMWEVFQLIGHRPEILRQIVGRIAINNEANNFSELLKQDASIWHTQIWDEFENDFNHLSALQKAIIALLIKQGRNWSPFSEESMHYYKHVINANKLSVATVQTAIQSLREKGLIWQSSRGAYALEDPSFAEWFIHANDVEWLV